ncbi:MAG: hypothetical protein E7604_06800 [Ruminococcaceae bacterium]|nr:hypothetical protein [Oscillospiraceae bacterium]
MKRILAILLTVLLLLPALPLTAFAAEHTDASITVPSVSGNIGTSCTYSDDYFRGDPTRYNPDLALLSIAFAMSCGTADGINTEWQPVTAASNAESFLCGTFGGSEIAEASLGFSEFARSADMENGKPGTDTIGAVAANKIIREGDTDYTLIALGIRGMGYGAEWASNFTVGAEGDHKGFSDSASKVTAFLSDYINTYLDSNTRIKLWITGYSRSAIIANMTAAAVCDGALALSNGMTLVPADDLYCYTFATPRGVLAENAKPHANIFNLVSAYDVVPAVAPEAWGFTRHGVDVAYPTAAVTEDFDAQKAVMLTYLTKLTNGKMTDIVSPSKIPVISDITIHFENLFIDPDNLVEITYTDTTPETAIRDGMNWYFSKAFPTRSAYTAELEDAMRTLTAQLLDSYAETPALPDGTLDALLGAAASFMSMDTLTTLLAPMILPRTDLADFDSRHADFVYLFESTFDDFLTTLEQTSGIPMRNTAWEVVLHAFLFNTLDAAAIAAYEDDYTGLGLFVGGLTYLLDSGLTAHYPEVSFAWTAALADAAKEAEKENVPLSRLAFVAELAKKNGITMDAGTWAQSLGLIIGDGTGDLALDDLITREQASVIVDRYLALCGISGASIEGMPLYSDDSEISEWARVAVYHMTAYGFLPSGIGNNFVPAGMLTRAAARDCTEQLEVFG